MAKGLFSAGTCRPNQQIAANHDGKGSLKRRNLYRNQEIMMAKGLFTAVTFAGTQEIMMAKGWNLYRNPRNNDGKGPLKHRTSRPGRNQQITANHVQGSLGAGSSTGTRKSWWQRVSLAPEPLRNLYRNPRYHDGKGLLAPEPVARGTSKSQPIMMAKGLLSAGTFTGTQELMMAKGLFSAGTCGPKPAHRSRSWWQKIS